MEVIIKFKVDEVCSLAAKIIADRIKSFPRTVLGLATGETPQPVYQKLVQLYRARKVSFKKVITFNLDEYVGLGSNHPQSYRAYMDRYFFDCVDVSKKQVHIPDGLSKDIPKHCIDYENKIKRFGGIDLQLLGIGADGHIGFNEPSSSLSSRTRIKTLTEKTRNDNQRFFGSSEKVPYHVITMGIGTILEARCCLLLAYGKQKADAVAKMIEGPITASVPASILQLHPKTIVILDEPAASRLTLKKYYRYVYQHKIAWQKFE